MQHEVVRGGREFRFCVVVGYAALLVYEGPVVICEGGHMKTGSTLKATPETLPAIAERWLTQYFDRCNVKVKGRKK